MLPLKYILTFWCLFLGIIIMSILDFLGNRDSIYSSIFCLYYLLTLYTIWVSGNKQIQPYLLFYLTFGLFIGGRFWANLMGYEGDIWKPTYFYSYGISQEHKINLLRQVIGFMCCSSIGYVLSKKYIAINKLKIDISFSSKTIHQINVTLKYFYVFFAIYVLWTYSAKLILALEAGYLSLYIGKQTSEHATGASLIDALLNVSVGLAMGYGDSKNRCNYLFLLIMISLFMVVIGSRASLGVTLLLLLWIYAQYHKISLIKLFLSCIGCMCALLLVFSFSIRQSAAGSQFSNLWDLILIFLYDQGISLMVFDASQLIDSYPILAYYTRFFPGVGGIAGLFAGEAFYPQELSFGGYMCYVLNPSLYLAGQGLGWTLLSDIYLFSFRLLPVFFLLSICWGYLIGKLEYWAEHSRFFKSYIYISIVGLLMVPRASIAGIFPYIFYLLAYLFVMVFFIQLKNLKR